ncbi:Uncharacterized protein HZ326_4924 [Fusarium oxysporum f. sp. albedinis]|nr:Uncharacterized protein HZ326_4924 [Fusarium oxysporum f. sp. albedinis]
MTTREADIPVCRPGAMPQNTCLEVYRTHSYKETSCTLSNTVVFVLQLGPKASLSIYKERLQIQSTSAI